MDALVVDASVAIKWLVDEEYSVNASQLFSYDCYYLALAVRTECSLVTADQRFMNKIQGRAEFAGRIVHVSEVASELGHDPGAGNAVHEPMTAPFVSDVNLDQLHFMPD